MKLLGWGTTRKGQKLHMWREPRHAPGAITMCGHYEDAVPDVEDTFEHFEDVCKLCAKTVESNT